MCKRGIASLAATAVLWLLPGLGRGQIAGAPASGLAGRSIQAIGYPVGGSTNVDLKNTGLIAVAAGLATVEAKAGVTTIEADIQGLKPPTQLGAEFLTYVLWAVSPEGRAINLGGIPFGENSRGKLKATTRLQIFSLFVTAEPYSAVRQPSEMLILENSVRKGTKGKIFPLQDYKLMKRSQYEKLGNPLPPALDLKNVPLEVYEARNAVEIARARRADAYAPGIFSKASAGLKMAENALARKANRQEVASTARQATQFAEDARALSVERQEQERIAAERAAAATRASADTEAKAAAETTEAAHKTDQELRRQAELAAARQAQLQAEAAAREARMIADAEIAASRARAQAEVQRVQEEAAKTEAELAEQAAASLRARLLEEFNCILETRDSPRGLVVTMADGLFDSGKYDLRLDAREKLARFSGIVLAHPGLKIEVEGHTDSAGSEELNQKLSALRALTVRTYLVREGLPGDSITAVGFGEESPVADNSTVAGRQTNRRVELIVSGDGIGVMIGK